MIDGAVKVNPTPATLIVLAAVTGARRGELCALRWRHLDVDSGMSRIKAAIGETNVVYEKDTKTHRHRTVTLSLFVLDWLLDHRDRHAKACALCGIELSDDAHVLAPEPGGLKPLHPSSATRAFSRLPHRAPLRRRSVPAGRAAVTMGRASTMAEHEPAPAGWYPDTGGSQLRWWDGSAWTDHVAPVPSADAVPAPAFPAERRRVYSHDMLYVTDAAGTKVGRIISSRARSRWTYRSFDQISTSSSHAGERRTSPPRKRTRHLPTIPGCRPRPSRIKRQPPSTRRSLGKPRKKEPLGRTCSRTGRGRPCA